uniref:Uncharacterized protein n=1 Tax=Arundo donax TaxID=35708 RepID=A0A0A9H5W9_ARUDO
MGTAPGCAASISWHATAPDAASSTLERLSCRVVLIHARISLRPTK